MSSQRLKECTGKPVNRFPRSQTFLVFDKRSPRPLGSTQVLPEIFTGITFRVEDPGTGIFGHIELQDHPLGIRGAGVGDPVQKRDVFGGKRKV